MARKAQLGLAAALALTAWACGGDPDARAGLSVPVTYDSLDNGLRVVLSEDHTAPTATVALYYDVGFRVEPEGRTGFAHLFEHMMFQGSENLGPMEFVRMVQENGGVLNGSTRHDFTNYYEIVPAHTLERILWAEADRMRGLRITEDRLANQRDVVKNEVRVNVLNQPYGGFPWLDLPQVAFENWHNAHNFYGDFTDLDAATLEDVQAFFDRYYAPNNAVLVVVGDFESERTMEWIRDYFGDIPRGPATERPDVSEPRQEAEKRETRTDPLANRPAVALGYRMPERGSADYWAMGLLDQILLQGDDAWLHQALVQRRGLTGSVSGGVNAQLGNLYNSGGPTLWTASLIHDPGVSTDSIVAVVDSVVERARTDLVDPETLERARTKARSALYDEIDAFFGFGLADLLASFALFDDDPARVNEIDATFQDVTAEQLQRTAREYLRPTNRTILTLEPESTSEGGSR
ncbi:MAG: pitrilysin family protein [Gemmatimonadota bacterium]|nr:pitrilysin family protein [Gemmatimonadota bacterium]